MHKSNAGLTSKVASGVCPSSRNRVEHQTGVRQVNWTIGADAPFRLLAAKELCQILGLSRASLHRATRSQGFPRPVQIMGGTRAARYDSRAVWSWLEARLQGGKAA